MAYLHENEQTFNAAVVAICGQVRGDGVREELEAAGFDFVLETSAGLALDDAMAHAEENYRKAAQELFESFSAIG